MQLGGCGASSGVKPSEATCSQFIQLMQTKQSGAAYSLLSSQMKAIGTPQLMQTNWNSIEKHYGKIQSWSQSGFRFYSGTNGSYVNLAYSLKCSHGNTQIGFNCVEENSKWLIKGMKIR